MERSTWICFTCIFSLLLTVASCKPGTEAEPQKPKSDKKTNDSSETDAGTEPSDDAALPPEILNGAYLTLGSATLSEAIASGLIKPSSIATVDNATERLVSCALYPSGTDAQSRTNRIDISKLKKKWLIKSQDGSGSILQVTDNILAPGKDLTGVFTVPRVLLAGGIEMDLQLTGKDPATNTKKTIIIRAQLEAVN